MLSPTRSLSNRALKSEQPRTTFAPYRIVQGEEAIRQSSMASINATVQVPRLKMTRVHIPFTFRLLETGNNSYEGNVRVIYLGMRHHRKTP